MLKQVVEESGRKSKFKCFNKETAKSHAGSHYPSHQQDGAPLLHIRLLMKLEGLAFKAVYINILFKLIFMSFGGINFENIIFFIKFGHF